jgi:transposase InsO family protein
MIDAMRIEERFTTTELCEALGVSKSGYYAAKTAPESPRAREERRIVTEILEIHGDRHTRAYGSPRMTVELRDRDIQCSENRVARIMAKHGISGRCKTAFRPRTTVADPDKTPSPNRLKGLGEPSAPGEIYVSDITYVATRQGWLYLAVVLDLYSRKVAGWALADHMEARLVTSALDRATSAVPPADGSLFHSDRGCQYTSRKMREHLARLGITQSMSAKGYCYDNAKSESFFATIKRETFPEDCCFDTKAEARNAIFDYIETFYNRRRRHSTLGHISPESFLRKHFQNQKQNLN